MAGQHFLSRLANSKADISMLDSLSDSRYQIDCESLSCPSRHLRAHRESSIEMSGTSSES